MKRWRPFSWNVLRHNHLRYFEKRDSTANQDSQEHEIHTILVIQSIYILLNCDFQLNIVFAFIEGNWCYCFRLCRLIWHDLKRQ